MPLSRAVEDTRMPDVPPPQTRVVASSASTVAKGLPSRTTTPGTPPSRMIRLEPRPIAITGTAGSSADSKSDKSCASFGSNSHCAAPPALNQTSGASGASGLIVPRTAGRARLNRALPTYSSIFSWT